METIGRGERVAHFETVRVRKDGRQISVSVTLSPIRDEDGAIVGVSKIARDVTEEVQLRVREREAARQEYDEAKRAGKTASLLEQDRPNVFSMNVANILPNDHIEVELHYTELLVRHDIQASMSRIGNPYDNAKAESFMKTLKQEEVDGRAYRDVRHARTSIGIFIEQVYNQHRLHSALAYRPPAEFEANLSPRWAAAQQPRAAEINPSCP